MNAPIRIAVVVGDTEFEELAEDLEASLKKAYPGHVVEVVYE